MEIFDNLNDKELSQYKNVIFSFQEFNENGKELYLKFRMVLRSETFEIWNEYDSNGLLIHSRNSNGFDGWYDYDANGNQVHLKQSNGKETWWEYDANGNMIPMTYLFILKIHLVLKTGIPMIQKAKKSII